MEPISAISMAITSLKTATEIAQLLKTSDETFAKAELKLKLADMMSALADAKISLAELKDVLLEKDREIAELKGAAKAKALQSQEMKFENGAYYTPEHDGPFCTSCYDTKKLRVRLTKLPVGFQDFGKHRCPSCGATYN